MWQAVEEELSLERQMVQGHPAVDTWGCRGMEATSGIIAGGLFLTQVAVTSQGTLLVGGAGGVQRSVDSGVLRAHTFRYPDILCVAE